MSDLNHNTLANTVAWFEKAVPLPISKNIHTQIGCHFEEVVEMIDEIEPLDPETAGLLDDAEAALHALADHLKARDSVIVVRHTKRTAFLDALCDQMVTGAGIAQFLSMDIVGGLDEVNRSNWSKFGADGTVYYNENRKVMKGPDYFQADLTPFV